MNEPIYETETESQTRKTGLCLPRGAGYRGEMDQEFGISICQLLHIG